MGLFLLLTALLIYGHILPAPFVFDDYGIIVDNPQIKRPGLSLPAIVDLFKAPSPNRPLAKLTYILNYKTHRLNVTGFHLVNIIAHVINAGLVSYLLLLTLRRLGRKPQLAPLLVGLIWMTLPVHIQSVTYIVKRMNVLVTMFYLSAIICYVLARTNQERGTRPDMTFLFYVGCALSGLLGLITKETIITLPVFIFLYEWYFFQNLNRSWLKKHALRLGLVTALCCFAAVIYLGGHPVERIAGTYENQPFTLIQRLLTQPRVVLYFLSLMVWPHPNRLTLDYDFPLSHGLTDPGVNLLVLTALAVLLFMAVFSAAKNRLLSFAIFWFLGNLAIESSIIGLPLIFEHRTYLPSIFPFMAGSALLSRHIRPAPLATGLLGVLILCCGFWTYQRNITWQDKIALWQDCVDKAPANPRACHNLGLALDSTGDHHRAIRFFHQSLELTIHRLGESHPEVANIYNNLGTALMKTELYSQAGQYFKAALQHQQTASAPVYLNMAKLYHNLGKVEQYLGNTDRAIGYYKQALAATINTVGPDHPDTARVYNNLGVACEISGDLLQAENFYRLALIVFRDRFGNDDPATRTIMNNLSGLQPLFDEKKGNRRPKAEHAF